MKNFLFDHPIILGGVVPMLLFGLMTFPLKILNGKVHFSYYVFLSGIGVTVVGLIAVLLFSGEVEASLSKILLGIINGVLWGTGLLFIFLALLNPKATVAQLSPIYNMNTLIAVLIGILFFAEWQNIVVWKTIVGTILIIALIIRRLRYL